jgi:hypothetical protein
MANALVRRLGHVEGIDGTRLHVGVDYDSVMVGIHRLNRDQAESFAQLFIGACWEAGRNAEREAVLELGNESALD